MKTYLYLYDTSTDKHMATTEHDSLIEAVVYAQDALRLQNGVMYNTPYTFVDCRANIGAITSYDEVAPYVFPPLVIESARPTRPTLHDTSMCFIMTMLEKSAKRTRANKTLRHTSLGSRFSRLLVFGYSGYLPRALTPRGKIAHTFKYAA